MVRGVSLACPAELDGRHHWCLRRSDRSSEWKTHARSATAFFVGGRLDVGLQTTTQPVFGLLRISIRQADRTAKHPTFGPGSITRQRRAWPYPCSVSLLISFSRVVSARVGDVYIASFFVFCLFISCFRGHSSPSGTTRPELACTFYFYTACGMSHPSIAHRFHNFVQQQNRSDPHILV